MLQYSVIFCYYTAQSLLVTRAREAALSFCKMTELSHGRRRVRVGGGLVAGVRGGDSRLGHGHEGLSHARGGAGPSWSHGRLFRSRWLSRSWLVQVMNYI
jgi:hypothetical protein